MSTAEEDLRIRQEVNAYLEEIFAGGDPSAPMPLELSPCAFLRAVRKMSYQMCGYRMSDKAAEVLQVVAEARLIRLLGAAGAVAEHSGREGIRVDDLDFAQGMLLMNGSL